MTWRVISAWPLRLGTESPFNPFLAILARHPPQGATLPRLSPNAALALNATFTSDFLAAWERVAHEGWRACEATLVKRFPAAYPPEHFTFAAFRAALAVVHGRA
jgi:hypothetical protein